jgi:transcriptional regulator
MYIPPHFAETDVGKLHDFIEANSFALLVSNHQGGLFATHLPFLLDRTAGDRGTLIAHMARANPQWQDLAGQHVLAVFSGPHAYVSPTWYQSENVVPTWNYIAVHAYGTCRLVESPEQVHDLLVRMVETYERAMPTPWSIERDSAFLEKMARQVVAFRIELTRLEGKWKLNQNHPAERREKVVAALAKSTDSAVRAIARWMEEMLR